MQEENVRRKAASAKRKAEAEPEDAAAAGPGKKPNKKDWWEVEARGGQPLEDDDDVEYYRQEVGGFAVHGMSKGPAQNLHELAQMHAGFRTAIETCHAPAGLGSKVVSTLIGWVRY